jgi:hypothetical protein
MSDPSDPPNTEKGTQLPTCSCVKDPYAYLPPELQPKNRTWKSTFRQVTCPGCGLEYWTNCEGDVCTDCQKKGIQIPKTVGKK